MSHPRRRARRSLILFGASGAYPVFGLGRWWTVLSAGWLHGGLLHIVLQHDWRAADGAGDRRALRPGADGDHLLPSAASAGFVLSSMAGYFLPLPIPLLHGAR